jgi:DNA-binding FadR family transcriptional regulator
MMIKNVHGNTVDYLGSAIVAGRFGVSGAMPPEPLLCEELGVSRTVIRESVKSLVAKGLIQTGPKVGTRVRPSSQWNWFDPDVIGWQAKAGLTPEFIRDLQDLRMIMEPAAIRLAALRASEKDISEIEAAYAGMVDAVDNGGDYVRFDLLFHQGMIRASHNRMLEKMDQALGALLRTSFEISTVKKNGPRDSLPMHRAVLDAVIAHDADRAEDAIILLIEDAHKDMAQVLKARRRTPQARARVAPPRRAAHVA